MREPNLRRSLAVVSVTVLLLPGLGSSAVGDPWGTETRNTGAHPDEDPHTFCFGGSLGDDAAGNVSSAENRALDPTQARVRFNVSCDLSGRSETDVVWRQGNLPPRTTGRTFCQDHESSGNQCDQFYATLDMRLIRVGPHDEIDTTGTVCHELGHSAGLSHGDHKSDCMQSTGTQAPTVKKFRRYGKHHRGHINRWF
ncbi:MAG: hypothetical protein ACRDO7_00245 [Nocardioidaceae bacterium]